MGPGNRENPLHIHRATKQVHGEQGTGGGSDRRRNALRIEEIGARLHIHKHGCGTDGTDGFRGGEETEGGGDHLIARPDAQAPQGKNQGVGAAVAADGVGHVAGRGKSGFERGNGGAADVLAAAQHLRHRLIETITKLPQLFVEAEGGHMHGRNLNPRERIHKGARGPLPCWS